MVLVLVVCADGGSSVCVWCDGGGDGMMEYR